MSKRQSGTDYLVTIRNVREVLLCGTADAGFWREQLAHHELYPYLEGGKAQQTIGGTVLRWLGMRFFELTVSVAVSLQPDGSSDDGRFLAAAVNSSRMLALMERRMFKTPYVHAGLRVASNRQVGIELSSYGNIALSTYMEERTTHPTSVDTTWEGPIFLPRSISESGAYGGVFYARLGGPTACYAWQPDGDVLILAQPRDSLVRLVSEAHFDPIEWRIGQQAIHARSKTFDGLRS